MLRVAGGLNTDISGSFFDLYGAASVIYAKCSGLVI